MFGKKNKTQLFLLFQFILPQAFISRCLGYLARTTCVPLKNKLIWAFISYYRVDLSEAEEKNYKAYKTFNDFFTRKLCPQKRAYQLSRTKVLIPVDGTLNQFGTVQAGSLLQAKSRQYTLAALLADKESAKLFKKAHYATFYLAPHNYHRVHMPIDGYLKKMVYVPGRLFSVNEQTVSGINDIFAKNERLICYFSTTMGDMVLILVGALIVAAINTVWHGNVTPHEKRQITTFSYADAPLYFKQGQEIGHFELGSTVIFLLASSQFVFSPTCQIAGKIKLGDILGS